MERSVWILAGSTTFGRIVEVGEIELYDLEYVPDQHHKEVDHIDMVDINSAYVNNKHLVRAANLKTLSNQASTIVPYKGRHRHQWKHNAFTHM